MDLAKQVKGKKLVVFIGSGGVGKTTVSAGMGLYLAKNGVKSLVITMDPARRLANALGLKDVGNNEVKVQPNLYCMQLDSKHAFDEMMVNYLIDKPGFGKEKVNELLNNTFYQGLSDAFIGTQEYIASGKLYGLVSAKKYETIVVDTPPSKHSIDFIKAPNKLLDALDSRVVKLLVRPYSILQRAANAVLKGASSITGSAFLKAFASFFTIFDIEVYEEFRERVLSIHQTMLDHSQSIFYVVASPKPASLRESLKMIRTLEELDLPLGGVIVNRCHNDPLAGIRDRFEEFSQRKDLQQGFTALIAKHIESVSPEISKAFVEGMIDFVRDLSDQAQIEAREVQRHLLAQQIPLCTLPALPHAISDLPSLQQLITYF